MVHDTCRDAVLPAKITPPTWLAASSTNRKAVRRHVFLAVCIRRATTSARAEQPGTPDSNATPSLETAITGAAGLVAGLRAAYRLPQHEPVDRTSATNKICAKLAP